MILYQRVSCFHNFVNFLAANGFSIGGMHSHPLLATKVIIRQIACTVAFRTRSRLDEVLITALTHKVHRYAPPA